jgi:hypothetical protein
MTDSLQKWKNKTKQRKKLELSHALKRGPKMTNLNEKEERREHDPMMSN